MKDYVCLKDICKQYDNSDSLSVDSFELSIKKGEFIVFVGPSGCGKSTTLRMIAGLEKITSGSLSVDGKQLNDVHPKDRDMAMVFQNYALYPHMSVKENIVFGLRVLKQSAEEIAEKLKWASQILGLDELLHRKPKDLSGGQRQRVALGRAIVRNPKVFLMDEPLSNLDAKLRVSMRNEITKLHRELSATTIYVTHDQVEAMTMADRVVVMKDGIIQQIGKPMDLYHNPANTFVAAFLGAPQMNLFEVEIVGRSLRFASGLTIAINEQQYEAVKHLMRVKVGVRPENIVADKDKLTDFPKDKLISAPIHNMERMGNENYVHITLGGESATLRVDSKKMHESVGDSFSFAFAEEYLSFFNSATGAAIPVAAS
ncbi:ABC transporter ATP-binding protein [Psychromonas ossibalaenae]|uniref:ABC transporter ATP-binding protein n=1 Tax=Psychromonas ossibalaenae TaxID=444922 RepID=UPI00036DBF83|nr:sn-glycerol-3-phosphate ABC transporter ATP-binding protein UgpC [Psychromonas ossibalaenae]